MKYILSLACLLLVSASLWAQDKTILNKIVATVGDEYIMLSDVEEQVALTKDRQGTLPEDFRCQVMDNLLLQKLLVNQAKLDSVEIKDEEVEQQLNARIDQILDYMNGDVSQFEAYYGQGIEQVKSEFREDLKNQLLSERMKAKVLDGITVTPGEIKEFFSQIPKDSLPYFNAEVEIREIVYKPKVNAEERQKALDKINSLRTRIVDGGEDFATLAQKNSDDTGSGRIGGDLGISRRGKFVADFEAAAYKLEKDEVSPVIETEFGFHIIKLIEQRRGNTIHPRHILIKPQITDDDLSLASQKLDSIRREILKDSLSFSLAVKRFSDKNTESYNNDGLLVNAASGNSIFETADLDPDVYFAVEKLKPGEITAPIKFSERDGSTAFRIIQLISRSTPHRANLQQDFSKIQTATIEQKKNGYLLKWIADKVQSTYIQIDPMYRACPNLDKWLTVRN